MDIGASIFFTEYSISPTELGMALEQRGFDSLWVAEHSHIPVTRRFNVPTGGELERQYYDVMDPFVTLSAAAVATKRLKLATGVCLVIQRDTIQTAKLVASLDQISGGRFIFGIGGGWNAEELEDHGTVYETRFKKLREQIEAMKAIWTNDKAEYHGELVRYAARRAIRYGDGIIPQASSAGSGEAEEFLPRFRQMAEEAGRDPNSLSVTLGGAPEDPVLLKRYRDLGVVRMNVRLPPVKADEILPVLDRWAKLIPQLH